MTGLDFALGRSAQPSELAWLRTMCLMCGTQFLFPLLESAVFSPGGSILDRWRHTRQLERIINELENGVGPSCFALGELQEKIYEG